MLVRSAHKHMQQKNIREGNYCFPDGIRKQFWYCFNDYECKHHDFGTQSKSLYKLVSVTKGSLFQVMKIDGEEEAWFYLRFIYGLSASKVKTFCNLAMLLSVLL